MRSRDCIEKCEVLFVKGKNETRLMSPLLYLVRILGTQATEQEK
jgi:hypothetical protein